MASPTNEQIKLESDRRKRLLTEYLSSSEYVDKLKQRLQINDACESSVEAQAYTWKLCERLDNPTEGCIFFIENFLWTFNPKEEPKHFPFILFDFQKRAIRDFIEHIDNGRDLMLEKSREMGASWLLFGAVTLWYFLFREGINFLMGSYKEDLVDNKTFDSLMGKVDYEVQHLPKWLLPKDYNPKKHRTHMKIMNPENGNLITGDTMNPNFGRGSRKTAILFDELGFWQYAKDAWESAGDASNCRIAVSTPAGYNFFALLRESGIDILTLHWKEHPLKDNEWYQYECGRRTQEEIAQELDISYSKSKTGRVYPEWNDENVLVGFYEYDDSLSLYVGWDFGRCLTEDTEALTPNGWKTHEQINEGDLIYTLNPQSGKGEWQPMRGKLVMDISDDILTTSGKGFKSRFTNGHKFPVFRDGYYQLDTFENINSYEYIPSGAELSVLPTNKKYSDSFVELMAWFWTEGYINDVGIEISQAKFENFERIRIALLNEFGEPKDNLFGLKIPAYTERKQVMRKNTNLPLIRWYINSFGSKRFLELCDNNKVINYDFINSLTKKQLELFVEVSLLADGHNNRLKQAIKERTEVFAYANILLGKKISYSIENMKEYGDYLAVDIFTGKPKIIPYNFIRRQKTNIQKYNGVVWCPTVDNHIWLARSNGTVYFTGNTDDTAIIWCQPSREGLRIIDVYRNNGKNIDFYIPFITGQIMGESKYAYKDEEIDLIYSRRNWKRATHFGDPAGRFQNSVTDDTVIDVLKRYGIIVNFRDAWKEFKLRKPAAKRLIMDKILLNDNTRTKFFNMCMIQSSYPEVKVNGVAETRSEKPAHDFTSHFRSSFEYLALGLEGISEKSHVKPFDKFKKKDIQTRTWGSRRLVRF